MSGTAAVMSGRRQSRLQDADDFELDPTHLYGIARALAELAGEIGPQYDDVASVIVRRVINRN